MFCFRYPCSGTSARVTKRPAGNAARAIDVKRMEHAMVKHSDRKD